MDTTFCKHYARIILDKSPVTYIKDKELNGSIFDDECRTGAISSVLTNFYTNHDEALEALVEYKRTGWVLGELLNSNEFLIILPIVKPM